MGVTEDGIKRRVAVRIGIWVAGSAMGAAIVALPDADKRVVSLSETHGPSALDAVGIAVLLAAWLPVAALLWRSRAALRSTGGAVAALLAVLGAVVLALTIAWDTGAEWLVGAALLVAAQAVALGAVWHTGERT